MRSWSKNDHRRALKKQGMTLETREALSLAAGKAFLVIGRQEVEKTRAAQVVPGRRARRR